MSDEELARNELIYETYQQNCNPFIDFPELALHSMIPLIILSFFFQ